MKPGHISQTCSECYLKYEVEEHRFERWCPWCSSLYIGAGLSFDAACRHALKKLRTAGQRDDVYTVTKHTVHFVDRGLDDVVHLVRLALE